MRITTKNRNRILTKKQTTKTKKEGVLYIKDITHFLTHKAIISDELGDAEEKKQSLNLHYVGITRAIDVCYIMNGTRRYRAKYGDFYDAKPSSFLFMPGLSERRNDVRWD